MIGNVKIKYTGKDTRSAQPAAGSKPKNKLLIQISGTTNLPGCHRGNQCGQFMGSMGSMGRPSGQTLI